MSPDDPTLTQTASDAETLPERAGKYRIVGTIGQGGMGIVLRGVDEDLGRPVALKFIPPEFGHHSSAEQRFLREARAASALDHVNIGTIFGIEETEDHRRFIVMAYYEGRDLRARIADEADAISVQEALSIGVQAARGLAAAHARGIVHRDIKPSNILLTPEGVVKIVDFGLASITDAEQLTVAGARMGTPAYMSPEQASGRAVDARSDIWSLGVVVLEMLTRERAFQASSMPGMVYQVVHGKLPALGRVRQPLRGILAKALAREVADRYQSMGEFLAALETVQAGPGTIRPVRHAWFFERVWAPVRSGLAGRRAWLAAMVVVGVIAAATGLFRGYWRPGAMRSSVAGAPASASVYEKYLRGMELMKRWDKQGSLEQAIGLLSETTKADQKFALGFARLAEAQRIRYMLTRDRAHLESASRNAEEAMRLNPELAPVQVAWGRIQAARGNVDLAMASFHRAVQIDPNDADAQQAIGRQYEKLGRLADAEEAMKKAATLDPDSISAHDTYANFLWRQSRYGEAIGEWQTVVRIAPDNAAAYVNLGAALNESGRIDESLAMYQRAVELNPTDMAYSNLGTAYSRTGRYAEAVVAYRKALDLSENNSMVWGNLGFVYTWMRGMDEEARRTFERAIELAEKGRKDNPRDARIHRDLGLYYAKTGNARLAGLRVETALALAPKSPEIQAAAAEVYELLGQRVKAAGYAKRSLELGYARQRLEKNPELGKLMGSLR